MNYKNFSITMVCLILGIIIAWQYKSIAINMKNKSVQVVRVETLKDDLIVEKKQNETLRNKIFELQEQKKKYDDAVDNNAMIEDNLKKELELAKIIAGLTDVKGKGIVVSLDNSNLSEVDDTDILTLINELKASEAQAISINNERIVSVSEVRKAGNYIVVNGKQLTRPYVIRAIAAPSKLENALRIIGGITENWDFLKIKYTIESKDEIFIPKVDVSILKTNQLEIVK
jgi:uncharacterized protein YlxW (UPF0749 family)